ncbi:AzlD domain-containing protein [Comamonas suwonensis]|uniref:AzlD domain-containing protein n=1 Tax=Comamonas suwonensis TaxID=2606214 RepID=A0A843BDX8_9BURK|nr:AzlD domain-containing protein [Comamonas suwonensis]MBI1624978.1 AzlD domain-containing protein [Comamonas suwonensis]
MTLPLTLSLWQWILLACALAFVTKLLGYSLPERWMRNPRMAQVAASLTVALLAALTVMNTVASGTQLALDARLGALLVAAMALWLRAPFLLVVVLGAAASALLRWLA